MIVIIMKTEDGVAIGKETIMRNTSPNPSRLHRRYYRE